MIRDAAHSISQGLATEPHGLQHKGMSILSVGSVAYDTVTTRHGQAQEALGGSATYFSLAASYFTSVEMVAVVGKDFVPQHRELLVERGIDLSGLKTTPGKTFRWEGEYSEDFSTRRTLDTQLNVFASFQPRLADKHKSLSYLFLGNIGPQLQLHVLGQMNPRPQVIAADTMNFWIEGQREALDRLIAQVDILFVDEGEARQYACQLSLAKAAQAIMERGPTTVVIKQGEHGALKFGRGGPFSAPTYSIDTVVDPTGAGDSFAGGFMGYLAATGDLSEAGYRRAVVVGSVMGSYAVEGFGVGRLNALTKADLEGRFGELAAMSQFEPLGDGESLPFR